MTILNSTVSGNTSAEGGGGIDADDDVDLAITGTTFDGNSTGPHGGAIELFDGTLTVTDSSITGNSVTDSADFRSGGGIWTGLSAVTLTRSTVSRNSSTEFGGGIGFSGGPGSSLTLRSSTVSGNRAVLGGGGIRVPWAIAFGSDDADLIAGATLSAKTFGRSDTKPALLAIDAGRVLEVSGRPEIRPLSRLDVVLKRADGSIVGLLARLRDVLPGRYTFGVTGRGPDGQLLSPGRYQVKIVAFPVDQGLPDIRRLPFTLR